MNDQNIHVNYKNKNTCGDYTTLKYGKNQLLLPNMDELLYPRLELKNQILNLKLHPTHLENVC